VDKFFEYNNLYEEVLAFPIGSQNSYYRVIKGVYDSFDEANEAINNLSKDLRENQPYVSKISSQQKKLEKYGRVLESEMKQIQMIEFK
jgi:septal ring-binding cell division protein DamX